MSARTVWTPDLEQRLVALVALPEGVAGAALALGITKTAAREHIKAMRRRGDAPAAAYTPPARKSNICACGGVIADYRAQRCQACYIGRLKRPLPDDFAAIAGTMGAEQLKLHYGARSSTIKRWCDESKVRPAACKPAGRRKAAVTPIITARRTVAPMAVDKRFSGAATRTKREDGTAARAADHLRRDAPVYHCDERGRPNPDGSYYRVGNAVLTPGEVIARAERKGWMRDAWARIAA